MASKSSPRNTKQDKVSAHDGLETKHKQSKHLSRNKTLTKRASPVTKHNRTPREKYNSDSNEPGSLSYQRDINKSSGFRSLNNRASLAIKNDITQKKRESRNKVKIPTASVDENQNEAPASSKAYASPRSSSTIKTCDELPKSGSKMEPKNNKLNSVERRDGTPLSVDTGNYRSPATARNNSANKMKNASSNSSLALHRSITLPVSNSEIHRTNVEPRSSSASCRTDAPSRSSSAIYSKESSTRCYSAGLRTSSRGIFRTGSLSGSSSSIKSTSIRKMVKFKKDENMKEISEQASCDQKIIEGKGIDFEANEDQEPPISEEKTRNEKKIKKIEVFVRPLVPLPGDLPETDRAELQSRGSSLMLGSGKTRKQKDTETLEIYLNKTEYSNLVTKSSPEMYCTTGDINSDNEGKHSPRQVEVQLPKTYITKSGSLFLYSDSTVMKDKQRERSENSQRSERSIEVFGRKMSPRTLVPQAYPYWGKLVKTKADDKRNNTGFTRKNQRDYIGIKGQASNPQLYSWNYTVLPIKLITSDDKNDIKTVNNLTEAVLAYRGKSPTTEDKYLTMMRQAYDGKTLVERLAERAVQLEHLSVWTNDWLKSQRSGMMMKHNEADNSLQHSEGNCRNNSIARLQHPVKKSLVCRTPLNTPLVGTKQQNRKKESGLL